MKVRIKKLILCIASLFCFEWAVFAETVVNNMLKAYGNGNYTEARRLAEKVPGKPKAQLVKALCIVFDPVKQDMDRGLIALKTLYQDEDLPIQVWSQAALTYGRIAQLVQFREEFYGNLASEINTDEIFQKIINKLPTSCEACTALLFSLTGKFHSSDPRNINDAFIRLENFCRDFKGKSQYLVPVHLFAEQKYITAGKDYSSAVRHLEMAYKAGIANPRNAEIILYRIGRIYDQKLKKREKATAYYNEFLKKYPGSSCVFVVRRFLEAPKAQTKEITNGQKK